LGVSTRRGTVFGSPGAIAAAFVFAALGRASYNASRNQVGIFSESGG
jgi:hypothetical protein